MNWQAWIAPLTLLLFLAVGLVEMRQPLQQLTLPFARRASLNLALWIFTSLVVTFAFRASAFGLAIARPGTLGFIPFLLIHDALLWCSHYGMHNFGPLWIWHAVHHSDPDMDSSTAFRFHPLEGLWDQGILLLLVYLLQPSINALAAFMIFATASNFFVHANLQLPPKLNAILSTVLMTPNLHRTHHSILTNFQQSNYGVTLTIWDRLFRTLNNRPAPTTGLGIDDIQPNSSLQPLFLLTTLPHREWTKIFRARL